RHELAAEGWFIPPTVIADVDPKARLAQEEVFGPVLAVIKAKDVDDALEIANNTIYGLTGAFYSGDRERIERAKREFHVGNLYINRKCTGALVDVHPFGGFNMSGTDTKAGGGGYFGVFFAGKAGGGEFWKENVIGPRVSKRSQSDFCLRAQYRPDRGAAPILVASITIPT